MVVSVSILKWLLVVKIDNEVWVKGIIEDILQTNLSLNKIAEKWNKSYSTVKNINSGRSHRDSSLQYPLRR